MTKKLTRREALKVVSKSVILPVSGTQLLAKPSKLSPQFMHGVASGDPDQSSVVIWTRVSTVDESIIVNWFVATDAAFTQGVKRGQFATDKSRDYTVKIVATDLEPGVTYFYKFEVKGAISPIGQTKTLPTGHVEQLGLAIATCSNYPFGYFNAYDAIAKDPTIDMVVHLGDYIYEYSTDGYGGETGKRLGRNHLPSHEILSLDDYRMRHAQYKTDKGSIAMHARHPLIVIWDDHETANNPWKEGALNHQANEGDWYARRAASLQAYYEWLPIRDPANSKDRSKYWRHYKFGDLASLITLESRHTGRNKQISYDEHLPTIKNKEQAKQFLHDVIEAPNRNMLSEEMQAFLKTELKESVSSGRKWRIIGNQSVIAKSIAPNLDEPVFSDFINTSSDDYTKKSLEQRTQLGKFELPSDLDSWSGYPDARERFYQIAKDAGANDLLVVSGDSHSYWQNVLFDANEQSMGVELGSTGISSPRSIMSAGADIMKRYDELNTAKNKEIVWSDGRHRGFIRLQINHSGAHADYMTVSNVETLKYNSKIIHSVNIVNTEGSLTYK
ncbi:MAG: alkaline phosphatase [Gammaproteobacteria bacterium]|nr:alkaline phosphatase [Gammaproteobacteria bacterium]